MDPVSKSLEQYFIFTYSRCIWIAVSEIAEWDTVTFKTPFTVFMSLAENCQTGNGKKAVFNFLGNLNQPSFCLCFALWSVGIVMVTRSVMCMHFLGVGDL